MSIAANVKNGLLSGGWITEKPTANEPPQYGDKRHEYFARATQAFNRHYAKYASDYVDGTLEVAQPDGSVTVEKVTGRFANVVTTTASITRKFDDYKNVLFDQPHIGYVRPGSKLTTMGSVWLAINPDNVSSPVANGIFRRCNAVWNHLDYYGNVASEPIIVENEATNADAPDAQQDQRISVGYFTVTCQYNDFTRQVNDNTRLILGSKAYQVTGYADFKQEFTGDYSSVRLLSFHVRVLTSNDETDDMENHVAGGKAFSWEIAVNGPDQVDGAARYEAVSYRNGAETQGTDENPVDYVWYTSDQKIAEIDQNGRLISYETGTVTVTAELKQNGSIMGTKTVKIGSIDNGVQFIAAPPQTMEPMQTVEIAARIYGIVDPSAEVDWSFTGATQKSYKAVENGNTATISCYGYSETPLTVTATYGRFSASAEIELLGW